MQQTEYLNLNIIEGSDDVDWEVLNQNFEALEKEAKDIRTDFADELEQAKSDLSILTRLGSYTSADGNVSIIFELGETDLSQYSGLQFWIGGITATAGSLYLRVNRDSAAHYLTGANSYATQATLAVLDPTVIVGDITGTLTGGPGWVRLSSSYSTLQTSNMMPSGGGAGATYTQCGFSALTSVTIYSSQTLNAGVEIILYGYKK